MQTSLLSVLLSARSPAPCSDSGVGRAISLSPGCRLTGGQAGGQHRAPPGLSQPCWSIILSPTHLEAFPQHLNGSQLPHPQGGLRIPSQGNVDDAEGLQVGIRSQGCSEQGNVWDPAGQGWAAQLPPVWCYTGGNLDNHS